jgi:hypothetical protein
MHSIQFFFLLGKVGEILDCFFKKIGSKHKKSIAKNDATLQNFIDKD